jgi:hypothetical protein
MSCSPQLKLILRFKTRMVTRRLASTLRELMNTNGKLHESLTTSNIKKFSDNQSVE